MDDLEIWADQYRGELEKQASNRAATLESLLLSGDYEAIRDWLEQWESEDEATDSLFQQYKRALSWLRVNRQLQSRSKGLST